jgi:hypothetical protein
MAFTLVPLAPLTMFSPNGNSKWCHSIFNLQLKVGQQFVATNWLVVSSVG